MTRFARWFSWSMVMLALFYGFMVLGTSLWIRRNLTTESLATTIGCWGLRDSIQKAARTRESRDALVMYAMRGLPGPLEWKGPWRLVREAAIYHVFTTWWSVAERDRLFAFVAPQLRRCGMRKNDLDRAA